MKTIVGIDLGTTNSAAAYVVGGRAEIIPNKFGQATTPSVIGYMNGQIIAGQLAKNYITANPEFCVQEVKRLMGTMEKVTIGNNSYLPEEISAFILGKLKENITARLGYEVEEAVITVPANFNELQRTATKRAGELAGFKVKRIINEPTAAALAYGIDHVEDEEMILVYDFGGGTFDITLLEMFDGILDVRRSLGDNQLGGKDIDECLQQYILKDIRDQHGVDLSGQPKVLIRIKEEAEKAKIALSSAFETVINLPFIGTKANGEYLSHTLVLTQEQMNKLIAPIIERTKDYVLRALQEEGITPEQIDTVLLVGGSSKLPQVKKMLKVLFGSKIRGDVNPDEAVALGAAIQGGILGEQIDRQHGVFLTDTSNFTLGTSITPRDEYGRRIHGVFSPIIKRGTKLPCRKTQQYYTGCDHQTIMTIDIYEGEEQMVEYNQKIGEFELHGIPDGLEGAEAVDITLTYNESGMLEVEAMVVSTGKKVGKIMDISQMKVPEELLRNYKTLMDSVEGVDKDWRDYPLANLVSETISKAEKVISDLSGITYIEINQCLDELKQAVIQNDKDKVKQLQEKLYEKILE